MPETEKDAELISDHIKAHLNPIPDFVLSFKKIMMDYKEQPHYTHEKTPLFEADTEDFLLTLFNLNYGGENEDVGQDVTQEIESKDREGRTVG